MPEKLTEVKKMSSKPMSGPSDATSTAPLMSSQGVASSSDQVLCGCFISRQAVAVLESHASRLLSQQDMSYGSFEKLMSDWPDMSTRQRPFSKKW